MNKSTLLPLTILACALLFLGAALPGLSILAAPPKNAPAAGVPEAKPLVAQSSACDTGRSIQVSGTAVVNVTPDRALIQLGVQSNATTPGKVEKANSETINDVVRALKKLGIDEKDMVTDRYVIAPIYDNYDSLHIKGYRIYNNVAITLRDIGKVNQAIIAALDAGANQVVNVEFYLSDLRKYRDQARELAVIAAREKADDLAAAAGSAAGCVMSINENTWSHYNGGWYRQNQDLWTQNTVQNIAPAGGENGALTDGGPVNLGQISVRAEVSASFSLE